jgi:hypothetical protein
MPSPTTSSSTSNVSLTSNLMLDALIGGTKWGGQVGTGAALTYSFPWTTEATAVFAGHGGTGDYSPNPLLSKTDYDVESSEGVVYW